MQIVSNGGDAVATHVASGAAMSAVGGVLVVKSATVFKEYAVASGTKLLGTEIVSGGGVSTGTEIGRGGRENVYSGGLASGTVISGGALTIGSGATVKGTKLISGAEIVAAGAIIGGATIFGTHAALSVAPKARATSRFTASRPPIR